MNNPDPPVIKNGMGEAVARTGIFGWDIPIMNLPGGIKIIASDTPPPSSTGTTALRLKCVADLIIGSGGSVRSAQNAERHRNKKRDAVFIYLSKFVPRFLPVSLNYIPVFVDSTLLSPRGKVGNNCRPSADRLLAHLYLHRL